MGSCACLVIIQRQSERASLFIVLEDFEIIICVLLTNHPVSHIYCSCSWDWLFRDINLFVIRLGILFLLITGKPSITWNYYSAFHVWFQFLYLHHYAYQLSDFPSELTCTVYKDPLIILLVYFVVDLT